ncbi:N-acetyltransferase [Streptomyces sp. NPDC017673]|uniref:N-acetyltransferase n=1 Tax=unclassified Streptomyces TaxID=2593676 RepID=UPI0037B8C4E1
MNAHVAAVVPGVSVSVNTVLSSLEREPVEFVTDPWVSERITLVAEERGHVVAAAHLKRYRADDEEVGPHHRDSGEIDWFLWHPPASFRPGTEQAADLLMSACLACLSRWRVRVRRASGDLPAPAVYGLPRPWPHVRALYERSGFRHTGVTEVVLLARTADLPGQSRAPGSRWSARWGSAAPVSPPARTRASSASSRPTPPLSAPNGTRAAGLADIGDLRVEAAHRGRGWERRLLGHAADWLRLCGTDRVPAYEPAEDTAAIERLLDAGFHELTRTDRGWEHHPC